MAMNSEGIGEPVLQSRASQDVMVGWHYYGVAMAVTALAAIGIGFGITGLLQSHGLLHSKHVASLIGSLSMTPHNWSSWAATLGSFVVGVVATYGIYKIHTIREHASKLKKDYIALQEMQNIINTHFTNNNNNLHNNQRLLQELLLEHTPNTLNIGTALQIAASNGYVKLVKFLVEHKNPKPWDIELAIYKSANQMHENVLNYFFSSDKEHQYDVHIAKNMVAAAGNGHLEVIQNLCPFLPQGTMTSRNDVIKAVVAAARNGHLEVIKYLPSLLPQDTTMSRDDVNRAAVQAAENGHLKVMEYLPSLLPQGTTMSRDDVKRAMEAAARGGHLEVIQHLLTLLPEGVTMTRNDATWWAVVQAAGNGHLDVMRLLCRDGRKMSQAAVEAAARGGHLKVVEYLLPLLVLDEHSVTRTSLVAQTMVAAAGGGHLRVIERIHTLFPQHPTTGHLGDAVVAAARGGHLEVIQHLLPLLPNDRKTHLLVGAVVQAAGGGHLKVIQHLLSLLPDDRKTDPIGDAVVEAAQNGHLKVIHFLLPLLPKGSKLSANQAKNAFDKAAENGYLDVIRFLFFHNIMVHPCRASEAVKKAAKNGHLEVIRFLLAHDKMVSPYCAGEAAEAAAGNGHLEVICLLLPKIKKSRFSYLYVGQAVVQAAGKGHLEVIRLLLSTLSQNTTITPDHLRRAVYSAAERGYLEVIKDLLTLLPEYTKKSPLYVSSGVCAAAGGGHLGVIKHLLSLLPDDTSMSTEYVGDAINNAAKNGHVGVLRFLLTMSPTMSPTMSRREVGSALIAAAQNGYLEVVRFLLADRETSSSDIQVLLCNVRTAIEEAVRGGHLEVVKYLLLFCSTNCSTNTTDGPTNVDTYAKEAAKNGHVPVVCFLLADDSNMPFYNKNEVFLTIIRALKLDVIQCILPFLPQNTNIESTLLDKVVQLAAEKNYPDIIQTLLTQNIVTEANAASTSDTFLATRERAVLSASAAGHRLCVEYLLQNGPITVATRDSAITQAYGPEQGAIRDTLRMASVIDAETSIPSENAEDSMKVHFEYVTQYPKQFLNDLCSKSKLPVRFTLSSASPGKRTPIDVGGISKQVYWTLFASLCEKGCLSLTETAFPRVENDCKGTLDLFRQLGIFYGMLRKRNEGRSEPFLTGMVFAPDFFKLLHFLASSSFDITHKEHLTKLAQWIPKADPYRCCLDFLLDHSSKEDLEKVQGLWEHETLFDREVKGTEEPEPACTLTALEEYCKGKLYTYINPALALLESEYFKNEVQMENPETLSLALQGKECSSKAILAALNVVTSTSQTFLNQVSWLKDKIENADLQWLKTFVFAITGLEVLGPNTQIKVQPSWRDIFEFHSCFNSIDFPLTANDQQVFLDSLDEAIQGTEYNTA